MDQREITEDLFELIKAGIVTEGRKCIIGHVENNQLRIAEEDGSTAIITIRGPMTSAMRDGGARSMAAREDGTFDIRHDDVQDIGTVFQHQDGDDG